jgi:hypothetical protein
VSAPSILAWIFIPWWLQRLAQSDRVEQVDPVIRYNSLLLTNPHSPLGIQRG